MKPLPQISGIGQHQHGVHPIKPPTVLQDASMPSHVNAIFDKVDQGKALSPKRQQVRAILIQKLSEMMTGAVNTNRDPRLALEEVSRISGLKSASVFKEYQQALSDAGILAQIPRPSIKIEDLGMQTHYIIEGSKAVPGRSNSALDQGKVANLATVNTGNRIFIRHGKLEKAGDYRAIASLVSPTKHPLVPQIARYDLKTPGGFMGWLSGEQKSAKIERQAAQEYNQKGGQPKIQSWALTSNWLTGNGFWARLFFPGRAEKKINEGPMRDKMARAYIEILRLEGDPKANQHVEQMTKTYNAGRFDVRSVTLGLLKNLKIKNLRAVALRDAMLTLNSGKLSRGAEISLHTFVDPQLGIISDVGCKSGLDRTGFASLLTVAGEALRKKYGTEQTTRFLIGFDKMRSGRMLDEYRLAFHQAAMAVGLPMTEQSSLMRGLKWGSRGDFGENQNPKPYIPRQYMDADGNFNELGEALYKGASKNRGT